MKRKTKGKQPKEFAGAIKGKKHQQTSCLVGGSPATQPYRVTENALSARKRPKKPTSVICQ
jgi:hypothetical protein